MKIGVISDLHVDRHSKLDFQDYLDALVIVSKQRNLSLIIIAGDISNDYRLSYQFIKQLETQLNIPVLFVPGNHDYWSDQQNISSLEIAQFFKEQKECLMNRPYIINDEWAIVGTTAWYDYSYADSRFSNDKIEKGKHYGATWQDKVRIDWAYDDRELSNYAAQQIINDIQQVGPRKIILITHIVTHPKFVVPTPHRIFDFFNAFIGTSDFKAIYQNYPIHYSVMGHVHFRKQLNDRGITFLCPCLGYQRQWRTNDIVTEMNHALMEINI